MENVNHHNHHITNITTSPRHHITTSPHHHITTSPHHHITTSPRHHVTTSQHHITTSHPHVHTSPLHLISHITPSHPITTSPAASSTCKAVTADRNGIASSSWRWWGWKRTKPIKTLCFLAQSASWCRRGEPCLCDGCGFAKGSDASYTLQLIWIKSMRWFNALYHCVWRSRSAVCIGMAASMFMSLWWQSRYSF